MTQQEQRQALVDTFINAIYLYDDKILITFNYKEGTETVAFGEAVKAEKSSDMSARGAPNFERQIVRFGVLSLCRKVAAHFLHTVCTFARIGVFLRKACTACFPLHKKKNFKRTRLSSTLCVPLHPSAGWLQGSPYRRFLLPPAFRFAGAAVLPGSGLGNRNLPRSSLPVPDGACRNSTCSPGCWCRCAIPGILRVVAQTETLAKRERAGRCQPF